MTNIPVGIGPLAFGDVVAVARHGAEVALTDEALKAIAEHRKQADLSGVVETPVDLVTK